MYETADPISAPCNPCWIGAGVRRLSVVSDGGPVTVTVRFPGRPGSVEITPATSVHVSVQSPSPVAAPAAGHAYSAGASGVLPRAGLGFVATMTAWDANVASDVGACLYTGDPGPPALAYHHRCPSQSARAAMNICVIHALGVEWGKLVAGFVPLPAGEYGLGGYSKSVSVGARSATVVFAMSYD